MASERASERGRAREERGVSFDLQSLPMSLFVPGARRTVFTCLLWCLNGKKYLALAKGGASECAFSYFGKRPCEFWRSRKGGSVFGP